MTSSEPTHCYLAIQLPALKKLKMDVREIQEQSQRVQSVVLKHGGQPLRHFGNGILAQWPYADRRTFAEAVKELKGEFPYGLLHYGAANEELRAGDLMIALDQPGWYTTQTNTLYDEATSVIIPLQQSPRPEESVNVKISRARGLNYPP